MQTTIQAETPELFYPFRFFPAERKIFSQKEDLTPSQWAERYRIVTIGAHRGPWRNEISPHLIEIMDTWALPWVREIIICKSPQTGGTESMYNCAAYVMERDPGVMMFIMPSEADARKVATDRIIPMIDHTPRLAELRTSNPDDVASRRIKLNNGLLLYMAWSNSASALATFPVKYLFFDEVDKYPPYVGKETDPITLGEKRARTYRYTYKIFKASTPTREDGPVWMAFKNADVIFKRKIPCPHCGLFQEMKISRLTWPEDTAPEIIEREGSARYQCEHCDAFWNEIDRELALPLGKWEAEKGGAINRPKTIAYHLPSFITADVSLSEISAAYLRAKHSKAKLIDFFNDYLAQPFTDDLEGETVAEDVLYNRRHVYGPEGAQWQVPAAACILTCFVDVQSNRLESEVVAWGEGQESWGIDYRIFPGDPSTGEVWTTLDEYLKREWIHESGISMRLTAVGIDSGFKGPHVYKFVRPRQARRIYAFKGSQTPGKTLLSIPSLNHVRKTIAKQHRVTLIIIGTEEAKNTLYSWMQIETPGPGYMHFHMSYGYDYFRQLTAEKAVIKYDNAGRPRRVWVKKHKDARNEALDIRCGNYALIELINPNWKKIKAKRSEESQENEPKTDTKSIFEDERLEIERKIKENEQAERKINKPRPIRRIGWVNGWR